MAGKNIVILYGHPDKSPERLCHALMTHFAQAAQDGGHQVSVFEIAKLKFRSLTSNADYNDTPAPDDILKVQAAVSQADHIVMIYPLWMGALPGLYKMFLEQLLRPGFAMELPQKGFPKRLLTSKSADIIVTMGMPAFAYKWVFFAHSLKNLKRNILGFAGIAPIRTTLFGNVANLSVAQKNRIFTKVKDLAES